MFSRYLEDPNWELEASELIRETVSSAKAADQHFSPRDCTSLVGLSRATRFEIAHNLEQVVDNRLLGL